MRNKLIGFNDESEFDRMARAVKRVETSPMVGQRQRAKYPLGGGGGTVKRAIIIALGNHNIHQILFTTGGLGVRSATTTEVYVGEEFDYRLSVGQPVLVAKVDGIWWIVEAQQGCPSYCIDYPDGQSYVYGWVLAAPVVTCCPEASGVHIMTTSDSGATYESATFQCYATGTSRKWIFDGETVKLSPMLSNGNIQYRSDRPIDKCSVQMFQYEPGLLPGSCGTFQESICMHPLCGVFSCSACGGMPYIYTANYGGTTTQLYYNYAGFGDCEWKNYVETAENPTALSVRMNALGEGITAGSDGYDLDGASFDCWGTNVFYPSGPDPLDEGNPESITVTPGSSVLIETLCYPLVSSYISSGGSVVCIHRPFYQFFVVSGVSNSGCSNCAVFNGTFRTGYTSLHSNSSSTISTTCGNGVSYQWTFGNFTDSPNPSGLRLQCVSGGNTIALYQYDNPGTNYTEANCMNGPITLDYVSDNGDCSNWPASITVYPIL